MQICMYLLYLLGQDISFRHSIYEYFIRKEIIKGMAIVVSHSFFLLHSFINPCAIQVDGVYGE